MKKILLLFTYLSIMLVQLSIQASGLIYYDDTQHTGYAMVENVETNYFYQSLVHQKDIGSTHQGSITSTIAVNSITGKPNEDVKVVTWSVKNSTKSGFQLAQLSTIANDYESNHPGWKVMGLINGDQYTLGRGTNLHAQGLDPYIYQTYYPYIADSEKWFSVTATKGGGNFVGIFNDGRQDALLMQSANLVNIEGFFLSVFDEDGNVLSRFPVENLNSEPEEGETTIYSPYYTDIAGAIPAIQVSGESIYYVEAAENAYVSNTKEYATIFADTNKANYAADAFFGKGTITSMPNSATIDKGQFAIKTTNPVIQAMLDIGVRVLAQYEYYGEVNEVEAGIGFHTVQKDNNSDQPVSGTYNTSLRPRSVIGRKNDGSIVLMTIDDYQDSYGVTGFGINAILKQQNIVEAYQMDGGGSAQMWIRDGNAFRPVTRSADIPAGSESTQQRSVLNAVLFVVRTIEVEHTQVSAGNTTIDLQVDLINAYGKDIVNLYAQIGVRQVKVIDGIASFTRLRANTEYSYVIYIEDSDGIITQTVFSGYASTSKRPPIIEGYTYEIVEGRTFIQPLINDVDQSLQTMTMNVKGALYSIHGGEFNVTIVNDQPFIIYYYDLNDGYGRREEKYYLIGYINELHLVASIIKEQQDIIKSIYE